MGIVTRKQLLRELLPGLNKLFGMGYEVIEYHARRTDADPKLWKVVEVKKAGDEVLETKELATDLKRNRAHALVKLLRSNQNYGS
jgi:hypothetical protein